MIFRGERGKRGPRKGYQNHGRQENGIQIALIRVWPCNYIRGKGRKEHVH